MCFFSLSLSILFYCIMYTEALLSFRIFRDDCTWSVSVCSLSILLCVSQNVHSSPRSLGLHTLIAHYFLFVLNDISSLTNVRFAVYNHLLAESFSSGISLIFFRSCLLFARIYFYSSSLLPYVARFNDIKVTY